MEGHVIVALALAIPIILLPVALVWYINIGGVTEAIREAKTRKVTRPKTVPTK